jgi:hypothetical protein
MTIAVLANCNSPNQPVDLSNATLVMTGNGLTLSNQKPSKCGISATLTIDPNTPPQTYAILIQGSSGSLIDSTDITVLDAAAGAIPPGLEPEVDVIWGVMSQNNCSDVFGTRVARSMYCIQVKIGNNSGHPIQLAGIGFAKSVEALKALGIKEVTIANTSYASTRAVLVESQVWSIRNVVYNSLAGAGLIMTASTPFFFNTGKSALRAKTRFTTITNIITGPLLKAFDLVAPDPIVQQLKSLDDQTFRDNMVIPNNAQVQTVVFVEKQNVTIPLRETEFQVDHAAVVAQKQADDAAQQAEDAFQMVSEAQTQADAARTHTVQAQQQAKEAALHVPDALAQADAARAHANEAQRQLDAANVHAAALQKILDAAKVRAYTKQKQLDDAKVRLSGAQNELDADQARVAELQRQPPPPPAKAADAQKDLADANRRLAQAQSQVDLLNEAVAAAQNQLELVNGPLAEAQSQAGLANGQAASALSDRNLANSQAVDAENQADLARQQCDDAQAAAAQAPKQQQAAEAKVAELNGVLATATQAQTLAGIQADSLQSIKDNSSDTITNSTVHKFAYAKFDPLLVKIALGKIVIVGDEIEYLHRVQITSTAGNASPISVSVAPKAVTVPAGANQQFTATVANDQNSAGVSWSLPATNCSSNSCGSLSAQTTTTVTYTAPATIPASSKVTLTATSNADKSVSGTATITVGQAIVLTPNPVRLDVAVNTGIVTPSSVTVTVDNDPNSAGVNWQGKLAAGAACTDATCGKFSQVGSTSAYRYILPTAMPAAGGGTTVTFTVTSVTDPSKSATVTVVFN